jgi:hypothetical protein
MWRWVSQLERPMPRLVFAIAVLAVLTCGLARAQAGIVVTVDKSAQRLIVAVDGAKRFEWPVSTARIGYRTPNGSYRPERLERKWFSRKYDWSPMPYSIFFNEGYAIHGSYEISHLGRPASHGCIRLHPEHAAILFALVKEHMRDTQIVVTGERPRTTRVPAARAGLRLPTSRKFSAAHRASLAPMATSRAGAGRIGASAARFGAAHWSIGHQPDCARESTVSTNWLRRRLASATALECSRPSDGTQHSRKTSDALH